MNIVRHVLPLTAIAILAPILLGAQDCPPAARMAPNGAVSGEITAASCVLNDGSSYTAYRLDLPVRGRISLDLSNTTSNLQILLRDEAGTRLDAGAAVRRPIEAGSYRVLVNGQGPADSGAFTLTAAFTAEPGMLCSGFPRIGRRQTVAGTLGSYGCTAPDGSAYDGWALTTYGAGSLTVSIASSDFSPMVTLRGSDGRVLATSSGGNLAAAVLADSQYVLIVSSPDKTGAYQLTTSFQGAPNDTCRATRAWSDSDSDNAAITADSCYITMPGSGDQSYYNYYNLTVSTSGLATFQTGSGDFVPTLYLLDDAGNTLAVDSLGGGYDTSGSAHSYLRVTLAPGNYVLQLFSDIASGGQYALQYTFKSTTPAPCVLTPVTPGDAYTGAISAASCRTSLGLTDLYSVTLAASGALELDLAATDFPAILAIRDLKDNLIVRSDEIDGVTAAHIYADLPTGVYTIAASAHSSGGAYRLATKFTAHGIPPCTFTQAIDLNGGYIQRLGSGGCKGTDGQSVDYYGFTLSADSLILGVVTSSEVDGVLALIDASGNVLRTDDNSYGGMDPLIVQYLPAGSYKLAVRDASGNNGGLYQVDLRTVEGPRPPLCGSRGPISLGATITGSISYTACQYSDQTFADIYQMAIPADTTIDLTLSSSEFDAYLVILDSKGNVVEEDDDGGGNTNARITLPLAAGTYYVCAKPFGDYLSHGAYTLTLKTADTTSAPR